MVVAVLFLNSRLTFEIVTIGPIKRTSGIRLQSRCKGR